MNQHHLVSLLLGRAAYAGFAPAALARSSIHFFSRCSQLRCDVVPVSGWDLGIVHLFNHSPEIREDLHRIVT